MDLRHLLEDVEFWRNVCVGYFEHTRHTHSSRHALDDHYSVGIRRIAVNRSSKITAHR
jgi:hypothetical protein